MGPHAVICDGVRISRSSFSKSDGSPGCHICARFFIVADSCWCKTVTLHCSICACGASGVVQALMMWRFRLMGSGSALDGCL